MNISQLWGIVKSPGAMAIVAIASFIFGIYQQFYDKRPSLLVKTEAVSSVFNVLQPVGGLQISYAGQDLRNSKQSLWVITTSISNIGSSSIRKGDYDDSVPFGLSIKSGQIVENPTVTSENKYLQENLKPSLLSNQILFSPVILEPRDSFRVRVLVLGPEGTIPSITGFAKIAGLQQIEHSTLDTPESNKSVWAMLTEANATWVHFLRVPLYGFGGLLSFLLLIGLVAAIEYPFSELRSWIAKQKRRKQIVAYRPNKNLGRENRILGEIYIENGEAALVQVKRLIEQAEKRCQLINEFGVINIGGKFDDIIAKETSLRRNWLMKELLDIGLLTFDGIKPNLPNTLRKSLEDLAEYLAIDLNQKDEKQPLLPSELIESTNGESKQLKGSNN